MQLDYHGIANLFDLIHGQDFENLKADIAQNGLHSPIVLYEGKILDGRNRYRACQDAGVEPAFEDYEGEDPAGYVISLNLHRRHLNESQRAMVAARLADMEVGRPDNNSANLRNKKTRTEASEMLNVSERSVDTAKTVQKNGSKSLINAVTQGDISVSAAATAATLPKEEQEEIVEEIKEGAKPAEVVKAHVSNNSGNNEWYTPEKYILAARQAMGGIDLDPASSAKANETVGADIFYSEADNGLDKKWNGNVWLNPPYGQPLIKEFSKKLCESVEDKDITQACVLVNNATETEWFQAMASRMSACCFLKGRVKYNDETGTPKRTPLQGQAILYYGGQAEQFQKVFRDFGFVVCPR